MAYKNHFELADNLISHLNTIIHGVKDPFITSRYVGFVAIVAVTVYELAIKQIFYDFSDKKHKVLGRFAKVYFDRINGRIKAKIIKEDYLPRFGDKYVIKFNKKVKDKEDQIIKAQKVSVLNSYNNIIEWRNQFAHEGVIPPNVTYLEATKSYEVGKEVITCLAETMRR